MDEIAERLGKDALILSTTKKDGKVIMQATNGADLPSPSPARAASDFSNMFNTGISALYPRPASQQMHRKSTSDNPKATAQTYAAESIQRP